MKRPIKIPDRALIGPDTPLRLDVAAAIAFPDGGMTASGLRQEHFKGRLRIERIANKDFVTLRQVEEMRQLCARSHHQGAGLTAPDGELAQASARASAARLKLQSRSR